MCNNAECAVPANECCNTGTNTEACLPAGMACSGNKISCDEKADCTGGQVCCLDVTNELTDAFTISCLATCGTGIGKAQICTTNAECSGGACSVYNCENNLTEACESPAASFCSKVQ
jgi:hypothetical protein